MNNTNPEPLDTATRLGLVILAVAQGLALYLLHLALDNEAWPATDLRWLKALYALVIGLPAFLYLGVARLRDSRNLIATMAVGPLLFFLGWHLGWVESAAGAPPGTHHEFTPAFVLSIGATLFILSFFHRTWAEAGRLRFDYARLLGFSWQQALTLGLLGLFVGVFWLLLWLWAALFQAIDVDFFEALFEEPIFIYPVTWLVIGLGLVLIRNRIRMIATVQFMCEALIKALLPLAAFIVLLFLATLPVTGVEPIWDTGHAAMLMMVLAALLLFFFNAVLSDEAQRSAYPAPVRWLVFAAVAASPVSTALAGWALWLRIEQYGLTVDRLWAGVVLFLIALYTFIYAALLLWKRGDALPGIRNANKVLAMVMAATLVAVNTPLADLRGWAAGSQTARLLAGKADATEFDYDYLRFNLGAYGARALERLQNSELAAANETVRRRIDAVMQKQTRWSPPPVVDTDDAAAVAEVLPTVPDNETLPRALLPVIEREQPECLRSDGQCQAVKLAGAAPGADWLIVRRRGSRFVTGAAYVAAGDGWLRMGSVTRLGCNKAPDPQPTETETFKRLPGPFLAYGDGDCLYTISPTADYLRRITAGTAPADG